MYVKYVMWFHAKKSQPKHSKNQNRWIYNIIRTVQLRVTQNNLKVGSRIRDLQFFSQYVYYLLGGTRWIIMFRGFRICMKSWVESLGSQVTPDWSWPSFQGQKIYLPHFNRKLCCYNFRDKSFTLNQWPPPPLGTFIKLFQYKPEFKKIVRVDVIFGSFCSIITLL